MSSESRVLAATSRVPESIGSGPLAIDGGTPVRREPWPTYDKGAVFVGPEDEEAALRAIRSHLYFRYDHRRPHETECGKLEAAPSAAPLTASSQRSRTRWPTASSGPVAPAMATRQTPGARGRR